MKNKYNDKCFQKGANTLSKKKNINNYIQNDLEISSDESNEEDSNEETSCEKDNQIEGWDDVSHV